MTLSIKNDFSRPEGGYALLEGPGLADVTAVSIEDGGTGQYFGEDGKQGRKPFAFPVEREPSGALLLGPHIVDHVPSDSLVVFRSEIGVELGKVFWVDIVPSRNPGAVTSAQVFERLRREIAAAAGAQVEKDAEARTATEDERQRRDAEAAAKARADEAARVAEADAKVRADEAARVAEADAKARADEAARVVVEPKVPKPQPEPEPEPRRRRTGLIVALVLLVLAVIAGIVLATNPGLVGKRNTPSPVPVQQPATPQPEPRPQPQPQPHEAPPSPSPVDCNGYGDRLAGLSGLSDDDKVKLGQEALKDGCGAEAFKAFDGSDPQTSEAAAWNLARFYDPNETDPAYRKAASPDAASAAVYYHLWRDRSARQARALAKLCEANTGGGASLRRSCAR